MREQALFETLSTTAISAGAPPAGTLGAAGGADMMEQMSALMAELSAEKARSAALEAELLSVKAQKEVFMTNADSDSFFHFVPKADRPKT